LLIDLIVCHLSELSERCEFNDEEREFDDELFGREYDSELFERGPELLFSFIKKGFNKKKASVLFSLSSLPSFVRPFLT
jgi:hypothetical protein